MHRGTKRRSPSLADLSTREATVGKGVGGLVGGLAVGDGGVIGSGDGFAKRSCLGPHPSLVSRDSTVPSRPITSEPIVTGSGLCLGLGSAVPMHTTQTQTHTYEDISSALRPHAYADKSSRHTSTGRTDRQLVTSPIGCICCGEREVSGFPLQSALSSTSCCPVRLSRLLRESHCLRV